MQGAQPQKAEDASEGAADHEAKRYQRLRREACGAISGLQT